MASIATHVKFALIDQSGAATTDVVADPGDGFVVVVLGVALSCDTTGTVYFHDNAGSPVALTGEMHVLAGTPLVIGWSGVPVLRGTASQKLQITTSQEFNGIVAYTIDTA